MNYLDALTKRYAVKKFDPDKIIPQETIQHILSAGKLSASSMGLQPYKILVVESDEMRKKLIPAFFNPSQISTCSHLIVLVSKKNIEDHYVNAYLSHISLERQIELPVLEPFKNNINTFIAKLSEAHASNWAEKQAYIALGSLMFAAALEQIDSCPMEGFSQEKIDEILGLEIAKEKVSVTLALGYRAEDDVFQNMKKVRKPDDKLFKFL